MQGNKTGLSKILTNKNTVTVIGVVLAIFVLYVAYTLRVNNAINPITVPYAVENIPSGTLITNDMIGTISVPPSMVNDDAITDINQIVGKYSNTNSVIPAGSLIFKSSIIEKTGLDLGDTVECDKGYKLYNLGGVGLDSTYGNSIYPGNYIDLDIRIYKKVTEGQIVGGGDEAMMFGTLYKNIKVERVQDSVGNNVFADLDNVGTPSRILFCLPNDDYSRLVRASTLSQYQVEFITRPTNASLSTKEPEIELYDKTIASWIDQTTISEDQ